MGLNVGGVGKALGGFFRRHYRVLLAAVSGVVAGEMGAREALLETAKQILSASGVN